jgi:hypothetical protein
LNIIPIKKQMKNYTGLLLIAVFTLNSCKNDEKSKKNVATTVIPFTEVGNQMRNEAAAKTTVQPNQTVNNNTAVATKDGMNPAHGQTGHRCDLPVGAPLNSPAVPSKPNSNITTAPKMTVTPSTSTASAKTTTTTPTPEGMNTPHGQTGHRCDIAVGAALPKE